MYVRKHTSGANPCSLYPSLQQFKHNDLLEGQICLGQFVKSSPVHSCSAGFADFDRCRARSGQRSWRRWLFEEQLLVAGKTSVPRQPLPCKSQLPSWFTPRFTPDTPHIYMQGSLRYPVCPVTPYRGTDRCILTSGLLRDKKVRQTQKPSSIIVASLRFLSTGKQVV